MPIDPEIVNWYKMEPASTRQQECMRKLAPGDYEVYSRKLELICAEGRETFIRMGVSALAETGDLAAALHTAEGDVGACAISLAMHLPVAQNGIKYILKYFRDDPTVGIRPGDMFYFNDGRYGGVHSADQILVMPIFYRDELIGWVSMGSHEKEVGANEPGGHSFTATNIYVDGMQLAPIKVGENYRLRTDLLEMMANMIRTPRTQVLDVKAREAACEVLIRRVLAIAEAQGPGLFIGVMRRMIEESAEAARRKLCSLNDGIYRQPIFYDTCGYEKDGLLRAMITVRKEGDHATIDFTGSSPRVVGGNFNSYPHTMLALTACYFFQYLFSELKPNIGLFAPFDYVIPKGCIFDADSDDATSRGIGTTVYAKEGVHVCFEKMLFDSEWGKNLVGAWAMPGVLFAGGLNQYGERFVLMEMGIGNGCAPGGRRQMDGLDLCGFPYGYTGEYPDTEHEELGVPLVALYRGKWSSNSFGMGKHRGGRGIQAGFLVHNTSSIMGGAPGCSWRFQVVPGLFGGYPANPINPIVLKNSDLKERLEEGSSDVPFGIVDVIEAVKTGKITGELVNIFPGGMQTLREGDLISNYSQGGPGYGDVLDRPAELVVKDVRDSSLSAWHAQNVFKVAYDPQSFEVDEEETARLRAEERQARKQRGKPYDEFEREWLAKKPKNELLKYWGAWPNCM
ncbi:MAG: hypothetical protein EPO21_21805 [Chloroflexota bacterium]|nr:MAG: hypothetical protein EPO21_21805 [Chloroflexota bacterium]